MTTCVDKTELFKGAIHAVTGGLAMTCCLYNLMQWGHAPRNRSNAVIYGALWAFETRQTWLHWKTYD